MIMSTGMATLAEIAEAVETARRAGATEIALLKCTSGYPASPEEMHLRTIPNMAEAFQLPVGLSDHTLGIAVPVAAVALGACIIEKHFTLSRAVPGPDGARSPWNRPSSRPWSRRCGQRKRPWDRCITASASARRPAGPSAAPCTS